MGLPKLLIAEPDGFTPEALARLRQRFEVEQRAVDRGGLQAALRTYDALWFRLAHRIDAELLAGPLACRAIATPVTGIDHIDLEACTRAGVRVVSLKGEVEFLRDVRATAELTLGLTLALLRHLPAAAAHARDGGWNRDLFRGREIYQHTVGLVGVGRLGSIVARYFQALGARVVGVDPRPDVPSHVERVSTLGDLLRVSDIVSLHVALDSSTRGLISEREFEQMKPGAVLVNTSRGGVVDEAAMLRALKSGRLAGAALDVLSGEPDVDATHPVVQYAQSNSNVILTPHIGGNTFDSFAKTELFLAGKLCEVFR